MWSRFVRSTLECGGDRATALGGRRNRDETHCVMLAPSPSLPKRWLDRHRTPKLREICPEPASMNPPLISSQPLAALDDEALLRVRAITKVFAFDADPAAAEALHSTSALKWSAQSRSKTPSPSRTSSSPVLRLDGHRVAGRRHRVDRTDAGNRAKQIYADKSSGQCTR
jgi:hypothetical protein